MQRANDVVLVDFLDQHTIHDVNSYSEQMFGFDQQNINAEDVSNLDLFHLSATELLTNEELYTINNFATTTTAAATATVTTTTTTTTSSNVENVQHDPLSFIQTAYVDEHKLAVQSILNDMYNQDYSTIIEENIEFENKMTFLSTREESTRMSDQQPVGTMTTTTTTTTTTNAVLDDTNVATLSPISITDDEIEIVPVNMTSSSPRKKKKIEEAEKRITTQLMKNLHTVTYDQQEMLYYTETLLNSSTNTKISNDTTVRDTRHKKNITMCKIKENSSNTITDDDDDDDDPDTIRNALNLDEKKIQTNNFLPNKTTDLINNRKRKISNSIDKKPAYIKIMPSCSKNSIINMPVSSSSSSVDKQNNSKNQTVDKPPHSYVKNMPTCSKNSIINMSSASSSSSMSPSPSPQSIRSLNDDTTTDTDSDNSDFDFQKFEKYTKKIVKRLNLTKNTRQSYASMTIKNNDNYEPYDHLATYKYELSNNLPVEPLFLKAETQKLIRYCKNVDRPQSFKNFYKDIVNKTLLRQPLMNSINQTKLMNRLVKNYENETPMTLAEYKTISLKFPCPDKYMRICDLCDDLNGKDKITIRRSDIGERLKTFTFPQVIRQSVVNTDSDFSVYKLTYGCVPVSFGAEMQLMITKFIDDRYTISPTLIDGELELFCMTYWRLYTTDLIHYVEKTNRKAAKILLCDIVKRLIKLKIIQPTENMQIIEKMKDIFLPKLLCILNIENTNNVTLGSLYLLKTLLTTILTSYKIPKITFSLINGFFVYFKLEHILIGNTFNKIMKNQDMILSWFIETYNFDNIGTFTTNFKPSLFANLLKTPTSEKINQLSVFHKSEIYEIFKQYFSKHSEVSLELCIAVDNLFMMAVIWFSKYLCKTGLLALSNKFDQTVLPQFLQIFNKNVIPQYEFSVINAEYSKRIKIKFAEALHKNVSRLARIEKYVDRPKKKIILEQPIIDTLMNLGHNYLNYAVGPVALKQMTGSYSTPSQNRSSLFIMAIRKFEVDCILTNSYIELDNRFIELTDDSSYGSKKKTIRLLNTKCDEYGNIVRVRKKHEKTRKSGSGNGSDDDDDYDSSDYEDDYNTDSDFDENEIPEKEQNLLFEELELNYSDKVFAKRIKRVKRKNFKKKIFSQDTLSCPEKILKIVHILTSEEKKTILKNYQISLDKQYVILNEIKTFGIIANNLTFAYHEINKRSKCKICVKRYVINGYENILIDKNTAIACCVSCLVKLHHLLENYESNNLTFEIIQNYFVLG